MNIEKSMLDKLFLKSLPKIDGSDRINRSFSERHQERFKPKEEKKVTLYNDEAVISKFDQSLKFTNYLSVKMESSISMRLEELGQDLSLVKETGSFEPINFSKERITNIINLYLIDFNPGELEEDKVMKVSLRDSFGKKEGVRVYFILNNSLDVYEIILIDVFHLLIPSRHRDKKGRVFDADKMMNVTFEEHRNNKECISDFFHI